MKYSDAKKEIIKGRNLKRINFKNEINLKKTFPIEVQIEGDFYIVESILNKEVRPSPHHRGP